MTKNDYPDELKYNDNYSWVKTKGDIATIGVISTAANNVQEFVFVKLPEQETKIEKGETYVSLEAIKWSGHLSSPVSGEIIEVNNSLFDQPEAINKDPYGSWIMKVRLDDSSELDTLYDSEKAKEIYEKK